MLDQLSKCQISVDDCYQYLWDKIFTLRSRDYDQKFPNWPGLVGIEIEMLPVLAKQNPLQGKMAVPMAGGIPNITDILVDLAHEQGWTVEFLRNSQNEKILSVNLDKGDRITFEPGGQLEFSSIPYPCLSDTFCRLEQVQKIFDLKFQQNDITVIQLGINPWDSVETIGLQIDKPRYVAMDTYFRKIGPMGQRMMRQTCSEQINIDFGPSETILAKRYLAANLLAPFAAAIFANSSVVDQKVQSYVGYRSYVWRGLDHNRTGFYQLNTIARLLNKQSCVESYLNFALAAPLVFIEGLSYKVPERSLTFKEWLSEPQSNIAPQTTDFETHLSLLFPEVRPKGFIELRSADCLSRTWQDVPGAFFIALLYDDRNLDNVIELLEPYLNNLNSLLAESKLGLQNKIIAEMSNRLMKMALFGFERFDPCFRKKGADYKLRKYYQHFTEKNICPGDELLTELKKSNRSFPTPEMVRQLDDDWQNLLF